MSEVVVVVRRLTRPVTMEVLLLQSWDSYYSFHWWLQQQHPSSTEENGLSDVVVAEA
jgi:hypothetical protein